MGDVCNGGGGVWNPKQDYIAVVQAGVLNAWVKV